jgi:hypothetical protein
LFGEGGAFGIDDLEVVGGAAEVEAAGEGGGLVGASGAEAARAGGFGEVAGVAERVFGVLDGGDEGFAIGFERGTGLRRGLSR